METVKWEYSYQMANAEGHWLGSVLDEALPLGEKLDKMGRNGWELCAVYPLPGTSHLYNWIFKRQIREE